jgi:signal recognition particle receptor subunit beta
MALSGQGKVAIKYIQDLRAEAAERVQLDFQSRELTVKLVYYGPALSGKTTNLQAIHRLLVPERRSRLMALETKDDRTLFFDLLPLAFNTGHGLLVRLKLFTVPGQVIHSSTRRLVLRGADGVAFIADSQRAEASANQESFLDLRRNLKENGLNVEKLPLVIQFNKRDLPNIRSEEEIEQMARRGREPIYLAVATRGIGVRETFIGLVEATWRQMEIDHGLEARFGITVETVMQDLTNRFEAAHHVEDSQ